MEEMVAATEHTLADGVVVDCMNPGETDIIYKEIFDDKVYARHGIKISDGDTVIDIGANIGLFALFAKQKGARAKVYCFEPAPETFNILEKNVKRFELDEVKLFNAGIAEKRGEATLYFMPKFTVSSTFEPDDSIEQLQRNEEFTVNALATSSNWLVATAFRLLPQFFQN